VLIVSISVRIVSIGRPKRNTPKDIEMTSTLTQNGTVISTRGDQNTFFTFRLQNLGGPFVLIAELTEYLPISGTYAPVSEPIAREEADDEDDAIDAATDMEWKAIKVLVDLGVTDHWSDGGFPELLEKHFAKVGASYAIAAE
jgi:hypothetical protein